MGRGWVAGAGVFFGHGGPGGEGGAGAAALRVVNRFEEQYFRCEKGEKVDSRFAIFTQHYALGYSFLFRSCWVFRFCCRILVRLLNIAEEFVHSESSDTKGKRKERERIKMSAELRRLISAKEKMPSGNESTSWHMVYVACRIIS